jgi:flagellar hook protein FlgE
MDKIMATAVAGLKAASARFEASAKRVAAERRADFAEELVKQKMAAAEFKANLKTIKTADDMMKSTLDILA